MYKRILVPVDGSPASMLGLRHSIAIAPALHAAVRLLNVVDEFAILSLVDADALVDVTTLVSSLKTRGEELLEECSKIAAANGVESEREVIESKGERVSDVIVSQARKWSADMICMGTHGRRGFSRLVMGSDAERVLREVTVPVLLVRWVDVEQSGAAADEAHHSSARTSQSTAEGTH